MQPLNKESRFQIYKAKGSLLTTSVSDGGRGRLISEASGNPRPLRGECHQAASSLRRPWEAVPCSTLPGDSCQSTETRKLLVDRNRSQECPGSSSPPQGLQMESQDTGAHQGVKTVHRLPKPQDSAPLFDCLEPAMAGNIGHLLAQE